MEGIALAVGTAVLFAVKTRDELIKESLDRAQFYERLGDILVGIGILMVVASIPIGIYLDRKKKARKKAAQSESGQEK